MADGALPHEKATLVITACEPAQIADLLHNVRELILTIRPVGADAEPIEIYLDDINLRPDPPTLVYRLLDRHELPTGDPATIPITQIAHIHIW